MSLLERTLVVSKKNQMQRLAQEVSRHIFMADDLGEALDLAGSVEPDLVVFDDGVTSHHIEEFLERTDNTEHPVSVVVMGDTGASDNLNATRVYRCLEDSEQLKRIAHEISARTLQPEGETPTSRYFLDPFAASIPVVGQSAAMCEELRMIKLVANSRCNPILIIGETGIGKEHAARAVHQVRHPHEMFVAVNCAALTVGLLESELFGHVKGAFTGADHDKAGLFEVAGSGAIFLDEVSEMPLDLQAKLLRVLQERTYRRVGGVADLRSHATVVASSNRNLKEEVDAGRFRRDLYYRLSVCPIVLAPLRSSRRRDDILLLADYFLRHSDICPGKQGKIRSLTRLASEALKRHDWPGNVRELRNVIDRAILLETTDKVGLSSIVIDPEAKEHHGQAGMFANETNDFSLSKAERELIARALNETGWQKTQAASLLGITRTTLYAKVKQYNIEREGGLAVQTRATAPIRDSEAVLG